MNIPFVDLRSQYEFLKPKIHDRINKVLEHGVYIMGPEVSELEDRLKAFTNSKYCITVSSGTEALLISLMALGVGQGDEVITTPFTFAATIEVIVLLGATPIFVDIEHDTCNIDTKLLKEKISLNTKAIIPVSLYGQPANMDEINHLAAHHGNIAVVEDGAQSFGSTYRNEKSCNLSTIGCTSFFPSKPLGCYGDGGAIFTNDESIAHACREIRIHGQSDRYVHSRVGVGGRMDTLQCAILLAKLDYFDQEILNRSRLGNIYNELLDEAGISRVMQKHDRTSVFAQYTIFTNRRKLVQEKLTAAGFPTAIHYPVPMNEQPAYKDFCCTGCTPVAQKVAGQVLSLPMSAYLREDDIVKIVEAISRISY
ncbi:DegT/DnrJ/EryC1/StrS family aminotransferase [Polynucleobacter sp. JS-Mosq-20-D10]|uniref:DegT/DnrJ/EryC1/StrS family aminotransferase n=1 Tax=Polynucleobacter sp. JS-Mosq-20-D10 TaxID=2576922 RepID=UPI0035302358